MFTSSRLLCAQSRYQSSANFSLLSHSFLEVFVALELSPPPALSCGTAHLPLRTMNEYRAGGWIVWVARGKR